jgi:hypothetical protein
MDVLLAICIATLQLIVTWYAVDISVREHRVRNAFVIGLLGLVGIVLTEWMTVRANKTQEQLIQEIDKVQKKMDQNQSASVSFYGLAPWGPGQTLTANKEMRFNDDFLVTQNIARNLRIYRHMKTLPGLPKNIEHIRDAFAQFRIDAIPSLDNHGVDSVAGTHNFLTMSLTLKPEEDREILNKRGFLYYFARAEWVNPNGSDSHLEVCKFMEPPPDRFLTTNLGWHDCGL